MVKVKKTNCLNTIMNSNLNKAMAELIVKNADAVMALANAIFEAEQALEAKRETTRLNAKVALLEAMIHHPKV